MDEKRRIARRRRAWSGRRTAAAGGSLASLGRKGGFIQLWGMEGVSSMYVAEIPSGGALEPEKHLYEEIICILDGQGAAEV
jgi:hypothetical protein